MRSRSNLPVQEEVAGKLADARKLIAKGCELCPTAEDVWLEYVRLSKPEDAKAIVARGVAANATSVRLWMRAAELELDKTVAFLPLTGLHDSNYNPILPADLP